jgi:Papain family cysteine protease
MIEYHGLGRLHARDERDQLFRLATSVPLVVKRTNHLWPYFDKPMDQGQTGTCVGHGWKAWMATAPLIQSDIGEPPSPFDVYDQAILEDEWADNDHDTERQFGTSVRAGAKVLQGLGYLASYQWAWDLNTAANWLSGIDMAGRYVGGPVVIGVNWYDSMFVTDDEGFLHISDGSGVAGGHCVCLTGWNESRGFAYGLNSWGSGWGRKGRFYMPGEVLNRLIHEDGEVCTSAEIRLA